MLPLKIQLTVESAGSGRLSGALAVEEEVLVLAE